MTIANQNNRNLGPLIVTGLSLMAGIAATVWGLATTALLLASQLGDGMVIGGYEVMFFLFVAMFGIVIGAVGFVLGFVVRRWWARIVALIGVGSNVLALLTLAVVALLA